MFNMIAATFAALTVAFAALAVPQNLKLSSQIHKGTSVAFVPHQGNGPMDSYLIMNLPFGPMEDLFKQVQDQTVEKLSNRGEAHITVVTPIEFSQELKPYGVKIEQINKLAQKMKIQNAKFDITCLGMGEAQLSGKAEQTYYVVVKSPELGKIREQVQKLVRKSDQGKSRFKAEAFYPHITLGFTKRDLHESDGVIKDSQSCIASLTTKP
jgi:2'-5' RNA ligase